MKSKITLLSALIFLLLTACTLTEDVTPPAEPTSSTVVVTENPLPATVTPIPPTATPEPTTAVILEVTEAAPSPDASASSSTVEADAGFGDNQATLEAVETPAILTTSVTGKVVLGTGAIIPANLTVTLRGFDMPADSTSSPSESIHVDGAIQADGSYIFETIEILPGRIFLVEVVYQNVPYQSNYVIAGEDPIELPEVIIHESTDDFSHLDLEQVQIALDYSTPGIIQVAEMYVLSNTSTYTVIVETDGSAIPFIQTPEDASNLSFQVASGSAALIGTEIGFALQPLPVDQKYGLVAYFEIPQEKKVTLDQPFLLTVDTVTLYLPIGITAKSDGLTDTGQQTFSGTSFQVYQARGVPAGENLTMKLSGTAGNSSGETGLPSDTQKWLIIGLGTGGMALIGAGLFLFMRDQKNKDEDEQEDEEDENEKRDEDKINWDEAIDEEERNAILDEIIALDEQRKSGVITKKVYDKRRYELKQKLKRVV